MKESKKKVMMQELSKEEATNTYGGATKAYLNYVVINGKIAIVMGKVY
ncbi:MAG: hypothetical protein LBF17_06845 [Mediterranea sp.]|jgi:hypothetical protein|nr:hypothetical protein [Mediterranea sp.]